MKIRINGRDQDLPEGSTLEHVAGIVRAATADDPMLQAIRARTGADHISYIVNGQVIPASALGSRLVRDGDDVRWIHPAFGG